jgi:hypothetical protein
MNPTARDTMWILNGIEQGTIPARETFSALEALDPLLVYFVFRYLREKYPSSNPMSSGVITRLLELTENHPNLIALSKTGEKDSIREWFDDTYSLRDFFKSPEDLVALLVEKIEN